MWVCWSVCTWACDFRNSWARMHSGMEKTSIFPTYIFRNVWLWPKSKKSFNFRLSTRRCQCVIEKFSWFHLPIGSFYKFQPIWSSRLASFNKKNIYITTYLGTRWNLETKLSLLKSAPQLVSLNQFKNVPGVLPRSLIKSWGKGVFWAVIQTNSSKRRLLFIIKKWANRFFL